jgi:hypothetical protein
MNTIDDVRPTAVTKEETRNILVGPELFELYVATLRVVLAAVLGAAAIVGVLTVTATTGSAADPTAAALGLALNGGFVAVGAVTAIFGLAERNGAARSGLLHAWQPLNRLRLIKPRRATWLHHSAAIAAQAVFLLLWTGVVPLVRSIPLDSVATLHLGIAPVWTELYWPVIALSLGTIAVNGLKLVTPTLLRLGHAADLLLQAGLMALSVAALFAGYWVTVSGVGLDGGVMARISRSVNFGVGIGLLVVVCKAILVAGADIRRLRRS